MNADHILKADLLDIIFEKRNKDYGAYLLRKGYNKRLYKSLGIAFLIIALVASLSFLKKNELLSSYMETTEVELGKVFEMPNDEIKPEPPQPPKPPVEKVNPVSADQNPAITNDNDGRLVFRDDAPKITNPVNTGPGLPGEIDSAKGGGPFVPQTPATAATGKPAFDKTIPVTADVMPSYPGGMDALRKFLERNLARPNLEPGDEISVKIKFIVGYDGNLRGFEIVEDGGEQYNNEVIRVLKRMPAWIPGKAHGENVSVYYVVPVKFVPQD